MLVHDPIANVERDFVECYTLPAIGDYIPVESLVEGRWYAVYVPTFASRSLHDLPIVEQQDVWFAIDALSTPADEVSPLVEAFASPVDEGLYDKHILKAIFVLGSGGAGKGSVTDAMFPGAGLKVINADTHFERFLKAAKVPLADAGGEYTLFNKARGLRDKELRHYAGRRLGIVIDMTGWAYDRVASPVKKLRELGYDTYAVFVDVGLETALKRNQKRADSGGRDVPDSFVKDAWYGSQRHAGDYVKLFGLKNFFTIDNDKDLAPKVWGRVIGTTAAKIGRKILARPLRNPAGIEWIKKQIDPETADYNDPKAPEPWPDDKPKPPKSYTPGSGKPGSLASKYASLTPGHGPKLPPLPKLPKPSKHGPPKKGKPPQDPKPKFGKQADGTYKWPGAPKPKGVDESGPLPTSTEIMSALRSHPLVRLKEKVKRIFVIGSFAKGAQGSQSDLDVLLEIRPKKGMTADQVADQYRRKIQQHFVAKGIVGKADAEHPQWQGRRIDLYFTYDAELETRPKQLIR